MEERFEAYQYATLFPNLQALIEDTQWHQYRALKSEIESLRARPEIQGYVITEFTDLNWEANGLLDMWRRPKAYAQLLGRLQQDDLLLVRAAKRNFTSGERVAADIYFSHYSAEALVGATVGWNIPGTTLQGSFVLPPASPASVVKVGRVEFPAPTTTAPSKTELKAHLSSSGRTVCENSLDLFFYPPTTPRLPPPVAFHDPAGRLRRLANEMRERNYLAPSGSESFPVLIASIFDEQVKKKLQAGGRVILLASDRQTLAPNLEVVPRSGGDLAGNWVSSFSWIRTDQEPFKSVGFDRLVGFEMEAVIPITVVQGVPPQAFRDVLAGIFYGWIHSNVGTLVQAKCGKGKLLICTFSLGTTYGSDPYATYLLDALVNYAVMGPTPAFEIPL
jgi:hypothetical protein